MKPFIMPLLKRNALVASIFLLLLSSFHALPGAWTYLPRGGVAVAVAYFCASLWANTVLIKQRRPLLAVLLTVLLFPTLGLPVGFGSMLLGRTLVARQYASQGYQMVKGCNGGAAVAADGQVLNLQQRLEELAGSPGADTNVIVQLQTALVIAREKTRILNDDCARRGHCETHPWTTNWAVIKDALTASEKLNW